MQGHDEQRGHDPALSPQNHAEIQVGHQQVGEVEQVVRQDSQLLNSYFLTEVNKKVSKLEKHRDNHLLHGELVQQVSGQTRQTPQHESRVNLLTIKWIRNVRPSPSLIRATIRQF